jgi:hypothetical protein
MRPNFGHLKPNGWYQLSSLLEVLEVEVEVEVNLRPTVSRPVYPGVRCPSGTRDQFFFPLEMSFRQLRLCYFVAPCLTREWFCNLLYNCFWALPEQSLLGRIPAELTAIFYCLIWDSPNLEGQAPVFISPRNRVAQLYPGHWVPFLSPLTTRRDYGGCILTSLHTGHWKFLLLCTIFVYITCLKWQHGEAVRNTAACMPRQSRFVQHFT